MEKKEKFSLKDGECAYPVKKISLSHLVDNLKGLGEKKETKYKDTKDVDK